MYTAINFTYGIAILLCLEEEQKPLASTELLEAEQHDNQEPIPLAVDPGAYQQVERSEGFYKDGGVQ